LVSTNNDRVLVFKRKKGSNLVVTVINLSKRAQEVKISLNAEGTYQRFNDGANIKLKKIFKISLKGAGFQIFSRS
ncbi:MAG: Maltogenic Amylase, C-terminal domain, partial [Actinomycetota bacterium]